MSDKNCAMQGKVAVVTGSTQGLGEATARLFAQRGAAGLIICGRSIDKGQAIADQLTLAGCPTYFVRADQATVADCRNVIAEADRRFGRLDVLVNCAGITDRGNILDTSEELFDQMFAVNTRGPFFLMQEAAKLMIREGIEGAMVNIISLASHGGQPFISAYSASKAATANLTKNSAFALMRHRIRINGLNIGWMNTPGEDTIQKNYHGQQDDWLQAATAKQPFGRLLETQEVARAIAFLASEESGMMTGSVIDMDQSVNGCYESPPQPT
ncbi:MAG: SDR family oxidoreductase [Motiliproteus sp.]